MISAQPGSTVKVHYQGTFEDGTVFDSSRDREPLEFTIGKQQMIPGFEKGVVGMAVGDKKSLVLPPEDAYGEHRQEMVAVLDRKRLPEDVAPEVGQTLQMQRSDGQSFHVRIIDFNEDTITLDANSPLAGQTLHFDVEMMAVTA